jgi:hypothetical protein
MEVQRDLFVDRSSSYSAFQRFVKKDMQQGLRCRLQYAGITGMKYIDFDYFVPPGSTMPTPPASMIADDVLYIPSVPSAFKDILSAVATSLDRIAHIRFEEISDGLERSLSDLSRLLSDPALHSAIVRINAAAENLEAGSRTIAQVFDKQRIHELADTLQKNLNDINVLTNQLLKDSRDARFGESTSAFIKRAITETMARDLEKQKIPSWKDVFLSKLSRSRHHASRLELLPSRGTSIGSVLPIHPPRIRRIQGSTGKFHGHRQVFA